MIPENELAKQAGITLDRATNGAAVDQDRQTACDGIFACGNVLHVHDLVDYVSEEAQIAGLAAADFIRQGSKKDASVSIETDGRVRYTAPQRITEAKDVTVYFRVVDVWHDVKIVVKDGEDVVLEKKIKAALGEMETVNLRADMIASVKSGKLSFSIIDVQNKR